MAGVSDWTLVVFVKEPRPGAVKTRLAASIGAADAAELYRMLVETVLDATMPGPGDYERLVFFDPPEAGERMRGWLPSGRLRRQGTGDLGARMADAFARAFARGASRVVLVGSDAPGLTRGDVQAAFAALGAHDVVLGPSDDGGYYLVGLQAPRPALFDGMAWSTPSVRERTLERAASLGLSVALLRPLRDVDTLLDLRAEWERLEAPLARRPELRRRLVDAVEMGATPGEGSSR